MRRAVILLGFVLAGCQYEWVPEFQQPTITCDGSTQLVPVSIGNKYEPGWNPEEHDLAILSLTRGSEHLLGPVFVDVPDDPTGDPEADGINWVTYIDERPGSAGSATYSLTWGWTDTGTTSPVYEVHQTSHTLTLPGCP